MTRSLVPGGARLEIYKPDNEPADPANPDVDRTPDIYIGPENDTAQFIESAKAPKSLGALKEQASFGVNNRGGRYRRGAGKITSGDEVVFSVRFTDAPDTWNERFRGIVRTPQVSGDGAGRSVLTFKAEDFVGCILGWRYLEAGWQNRRVAGTESSMLEMALEEKCPEIATDRIEAGDTTSTQTFNAVKMLKVAQQLGYLVDGRLTSDQRSLVVRPLDDVTTSWALDGADFGTFSFESDDGELANALRIDGGSSEGTQDQQGTQTGYQTITKGSRLAVNLDVPKSEVSSVEVWTDPTRTGSGDGVVVRLQKNDDGEPIDPSDSSLDHARRTLASEFLEEGGYTTFQMPDNDILDDDPWLLVGADEEGDGSGQAIGVNNSGDPAYRAYYPFPISGRKEDPGSIAEYRRRELQQSDTAISSLQALGQALNTQLDHENTLNREFGFDARSLRAHQLAPGDAVAVDEATAGAMGTYIVTKRSDTYDGAQLTSDITTVEIADAPSDPDGWGAAWDEAWGH